MCDYTVHVKGKINIAQKIVAKNKALLDVTTVNQIHPRIDHQNMFYEKNTTLVTDQRSYSSFYHICETINYTG